MRNKKIKSKLLAYIYVLVILGVILLSYFILMPRLKFKADIYDTCTTGFCGLRSVSTGGYTGVGGTIRLGTFNPDVDRFYLNNKFNPPICSSRDNPSIYLGIKQASGGQEVDAGLTWEVSRDESGTLSKTQNSFRPFWRTNGWGNAPAEPRYTWYSGDVVTIELTIIQDRTLKLMVSGEGKKFEKTFTVAGLDKEANHIAKIVNAIDQSGNEGKPTQPTNAKITGSAWLERYLYTLQNQKVPIKNDSEKSLSCTPQNIRASDIDISTGGRQIDIFGTPRTDSAKSECILADNLIKILAEPVVANPGSKIKLKSTPKTTDINKTINSSKDKNPVIVLEKIDNSGNKEIIATTPLDPARTYTPEQPIITHDWTVPEKASPNSYTFETRISDDTSDLASDQTNISITSNSSLKTEVSPSLVIASEPVTITVTPEIPRIPLDSYDPNNSNTYNLLVEQVSKDGATEIIKSEPFNPTREYDPGTPIIEMTWAIPEKASPGDYTLRSRIVDTNNNVGVIEANTDLQITSAPIALDVPTTIKLGEEISVQVMPDTKLNTPLPRPDLEPGSLELMLQISDPQNKDELPQVLGQVPYDLSREYPIDKPIISSTFSLPEKASPNMTYDVSAIIIQSEGIDKGKELAVTKKILSIISDENVVSQDSLGRDIIITTPSSFKVGQTTNIKVQFKNLKNYKYHLWVTGQSSNCKNKENGLCFFEKTNGSVSSNDQTIDYAWQTGAAGTKIGDHLIRVKVFQEPGKNNSVFCKKEGTVKAISTIPSNPVNISTGSINCFESKNGITAQQSVKDVTINFGEFHNVYAPANFIIYRNGQKIGETTESTYTDKNVPDGDYEYSVSVDSEISPKESYLKMFLPVIRAASASTATRTVRVTISGSSFAAVTTELGVVKNFGEFLTQLFKWGIPITAGIAVLMFMYAGYLYMTSQGDTAKINEAKEIIIGVVVGVLLLFSVGVLMTNVIGTLR